MFWEEKVIEGSLLSCAGDIEGISQEMFWCTKIAILRRFSHCDMAHRRGGGGIVILETARVVGWETQPLLNLLHRERREQEKSTSKTISLTSKDIGLS